MIGKSQSIQRLLEQTHQEIRTFNDLASSQSAEDLSLNQVNRFVQKMKSRIEDFGRFSSEGLQKTPPREQQRLFVAISNLQKNPEMARRLNQIGEEVNFGNVLLGLWKIFKRRDAIRRVRKTKKRVEAVTLVELLGATEKEIEELIFHLDKEKMSDRTLLIFIQRIRLYLEEIQKAVKLKQKVSAEVKADLKRGGGLLASIHLLQSNPLLKKKIHRIAQEGEKGNVHLLLWKVLKKAETTLNQLIKGDERICL